MHQHNGRDLTVLQLPSHCLQPQCCGMQVSRQALAAIRAKGSKLLEDASTLAEKLQTERTYSRTLEERLNEASTILNTQQQRTRKALMMMRDAQTQEESAHAQLEKLRDDHQQAEIQLYRAQQQHTAAQETSTIAVRRAEARAAEAESQMAQLTQQMQVCGLLYAQTCMVPGCLAMCRGA